MRGSSLLKCGGLVLFLVAGMAMAKEAWWLNHKFKPTDTKVLGIPAGDLDPSFEKVSLLTTDIIAKEYPEAKAELGKNEIRFRVDWKREGKDYAIVTGVYSGKGNLGSFILVAEKTKSGWTKKFVTFNPDPRNFSGLQDLGSSILWNNCLACGHAAALTWDAKKGFVFQPNEGENL